MKPKHDIKVQLIFGSNFDYTAKNVQFPRVTVTLEIRCFLSLNKLLMKLLKNQDGLQGCLNIAKHTTWRIKLYYQGYLIRQKEKSPA